ncbi:MAG: FAD-binding protein, partial [Gemmatimonadota bacterium]
MNRRHFVQSAIAGLASTTPILTSCSRAPGRAGTSIPAVSLDGAEIELERAAVNELGEAISGQLILSNHPQYDTARKLWNGMHDKRPAMIARCMSAADVREAVTFARERELLVAVRGGGHSWPGKSMCDG